MQLIDGGRRLSAPTLAARFWPKVKVGGLGQCWEWKGAVNKPTMGYGQISPGGRGVSPLLAHRASYLLTKGEGKIPADAQICHHCDNPPCCNPCHLFLGDRSINTLDAYRKGRRSQAGLRNANAKVTPEMSAEIRRWQAAGASGLEIAAYFGLSNAVVSWIKTGRHWTVRQ